MNAKDNSMKKPPLYSKPTSSNNTHNIENVPKEPFKPQQQQQQPNNHDLYQLVQLQQNTINRLTQELTKKLQTIPRETYEKTLNDLESEKYEHAKTKMIVAELRDEVNGKNNEIEFYKSELEKERCAYANVLDFLKDKCLDESTKSFDLISKIAETEIKYKDALQGLNQRENKYSQLCGKIKQKELDFEHKLDELNLKAEQDKYINNLISEKSNKMKTKRK